MVIQAAQITVGNVATAALVTQFGLILILFFGLINLHLVSNRRSYYDAPGGRPVLWLFLPLLVIALVTIGLLIFSDGVASNGRPLFRNLSFSIMPYGWAISIVEALDTFGIGFLILGTGGGKESPFTPILFVIPTITLFLHEGFGSAVFQAGESVLVFTITLVLGPWGEFFGKRSFAESDVDDCLHDG